MIESFLTVGRQIITLYLLMAVGFVLGKVKLIDDRGSLTMSNLVMYVVSPVCCWWRSSARWSMSCSMSLPSHWGSPCCSMPRLSCCPVSSSGRRTPTAGV